MKDRRILLALPSAVLVATVGLALGLRAEDPTAALALTESQGLRVQRLVDHGPNAKKVDIVLLGDGYTRRHLLPGGKYEKDARAFADCFFGQTPFDRYASYFNLHVVYVESPDAGADSRPGENRRRTAFKSTYRIQGIDRLLQYQSPDAVVKAALNVESADIIFVMVNDGRYGGSGGTVTCPRTGKVYPAPCFSTYGTQSFQVGIHEMGHSFANLGDEYTDLSVATNFPLPPGASDLVFPNLTVSSRVNRLNWKTFQRSLKWGHFLNYPYASTTIGAFEGGYFRDKGVYRPQRNCKMREYEESFCAVCREALSRKIVETVGEKFDDGAYHKANPLE
ncbi:MAG: hypothetical protein HYZ53_30790 [Planctomycetes bacterium]|nr:hypothetical protein [Planctomycetota bacterium]